MAKSINFVIRTTHRTSDASLVGVALIAERPDGSKSVTVKEKVRQKFSDIDPSECTVSEVKFANMSNDSETLATVLRAIRPYRGMISALDRDDNPKTPASKLNLAELLADDE